MFTHKVVRQVQYEGQNWRWEDSVQSGKENNIDESIPDSSTDLLVDWAVDVSQMQTFLLVADGTLTVETNDGATPDDSFTLVAGEPVIWVTGDDHANPLGTDVTALYVTNDSGAAVTLKIRCLVDPTV